MFEPNSAMQESRWAVMLLLAAGLSSACGEEPPSGACATDADCPATMVCEPGLAGGPAECVLGCHVDGQCGANEHCETVVCVTTPCPGRCEPDSGCQEDDDCGAGEVCEPSGPSCGPPVCVEGCRTDSQCPAGQACQLVQCITCPCPGHCE
jgi:hypothetical protein